MTPTREKLLEDLLEMLQHQIRVYTGKREGGLTQLQDFYHTNHLKKEATICECCGKNIEKQGHKEDCQIILDYIKCSNL